jgi:hypothetical protein
MKLSPTGYGESAAKVNGDTSFLIVRFHNVTLAIPVDVRDRYRSPSDCCTLIDPAEPTAWTTEKNP